MTLEDAFTLLDEMPEGFWEHEAAMATRSMVIKVFLEEVEAQAKRMKEGEAGPDEAAAAAVLRAKLTNALVGIIEELGPRKMQGPTADEQKARVLQSAGEALGKALGPLEPKRLHKYLGLAWGFPVAVQVCHEEKGTVGVYVHVVLPRWQGFVVEDRIERCVGFKEISLKVGEQTRTLDKLVYNGKQGWGRLDSLEKSWEEVVCPNSPYFPGSVIAVEMIFKPVM